MTNHRPYGLSAATLFIPEQQQPEFLALYNALFAETRPVGELQMQFFEQMAHASWNLHLGRRLLAHAFEQLDEKKIASANRYVSQYERSFARALKELKTLQTDLALRAVAENEPIADLPFTCEIKAIANEATKLARTTEPAQRPTHRWQTLIQVGASFRPFTPPPESAPDVTNAK
jgi:hypothetical protein